MSGCAGDRVYECIRASGCRYCIATWLWLHLQCGLLLRDDAGVDACMCGCVLVANEEF